jgi:hypothetical protein
MLMSLRFIAQWKLWQQFTQLERFQGMAPLGIEVYTGNWQSLTGKRQTKQNGET